MNFPNPFGDFYETLENSLCASNNILLKYKLQYFVLKKRLNIISWFFNLFVTLHELRWYV